jgi:nicotinate dehydrogenase medium molybdopterin subunit
MTGADLRKKNLLEGVSEAPVGGKVDYVGSHEILERALQEVKYYEQKPKYVGHGIGMVQWSVNGGKGVVKFKLDDSGTLTVSSAMLDQGVGTYTLLEQMAEQELEIPADKIVFEHFSTKAGIKDSGLGGSRGTRVYGNAGYNGIVKVRDELLDHAAKALDAKRDDLALSNGSVVNKAADKGMTYAEIVQLKGSAIEVTGLYDDTSKIPDASMCAQIAEVEVDPETGNVNLKRLITSHSTGTILNPLMHQGQIDGASMTGIGYGLMEHLMVDDGKVTTANFGDYKIPTIRDVPELKTLISETKRGPGPYNSMAIGETANIPTAGAIANAVADACGVRIRDLPITSEKVFAALNRK